MSSEAARPLRTAAKTRSRRSSGMVIIPRSRRLPEGCRRALAYRRSARDGWSCRPPPWQQEPTLDECLCDHLGVEATAELIPPGLRQNAPLPITALTVEVPEPVNYRSGIGVRGGGIESAIAIALEQSSDLFDGSPHLGRVITAAILMPTFKDDFDGSRNCPGLPGQDV